MKRFIVSGGRGDGECRSMQFWQVRLVKISFPQLQGIPSKLSIKEIALASTFYIK
jgi:hypothetical protein